MNLIIIAFFVCMCLGIILKLISWVCVSIGNWLWMKKVKKESDAIQEWVDAARCRVEGQHVHRLCTRLTSHQVRQLQIEDVKCQFGYIAWPPLHEIAMKGVGPSPGNQYYS